MTTFVVQFSYEQIDVTSLTGWQGRQDCLILFTRVLLLRIQS